MSPESRLVPMASETKQNNPRSEAFRSDKGRTAGSCSAALTLFVKCGVETWMLRSSWAQLEDFWRVPAVTEPDSAQGQVTYEALCKGPSGTLGDFPHLKQQVLVTTFSFFFFFFQRRRLLFSCVNNSYFQHGLFVYNSCFFSLRLNCC